MAHGVKHPAICEKSDAALLCCLFCGPFVTCCPKSIVNTGRLCAPHLRPHLSQFMASKEARARYWARSFAGWGEFADAAPAAPHEGLARLQALGWVSDVITQNVDRLHHKGGSSSERVLELHGTTHRVMCLGCGANTCRRKMQQVLERLNPQAAAAAAARAAGDAPGRWERALRAGTAADAQRTRNGVNAEQVTPAECSNVCGACGPSIAQPSSGRQPAPCVCFPRPYVCQPRACPLLVEARSTLVVWPHPHGL